MAAGDWVAGTTLRPTIVNITFDEVTGVVNHVGIGYEIIAPSGAVIASRGWTWPPTPAEQTQMDALGQALLGDLLRFEGVTLWKPPGAASPPVSGP